MAKISIKRLHYRSFEEARKLGKQWQKECAKKYMLTGVYHEGKEHDQIIFDRAGAHGTLTIDYDSFSLELQLGFLFSAYQKKIAETINLNMDSILTPLAGRENG